MLQSRLKKETRAIFGWSISIKATIKNDETGFLKDERKATKKGTSCLRMNSKKRMTILPGVGLIKFQIVRLAVVLF